MASSVGINPGRDAPALGVVLMERVDRLAQFSSVKGALTRLYLSSEHRAAALQVLAWMGEAGMSAAIDAVGNVVGRYEGSTSALPALLLGSHLDTVRNAGKYDGNLGVVTAIAAVAELNRTGERLPFAIEVIAFGDEEGVRFPVTLTGSRAVAGILDLTALYARDAYGVSMREALQQFGCNPLDIPDVPRRGEDVLGYVEVHIEQGPVLEQEDLPLGVVTAINGAGRYMVEVKGMAGHAGTVPMGLRRDALTAAAEMILAAERRGSKHAELVATVGRIEVMPGAVNVIPDRAHFTVDIRAPDDAMRLGAVRDVEHEFQTIATRRGVDLDIACTYQERAAACAPWIIEQLEAAVTRAGIRPLRLPSGAGHDGLAMSARCPIGMLFVRCKEGVSHHPAESIRVEDADVAARVLIDFLRHFRPHRAEP